MPDLLHDTPDASSVVDALVHFLSSLGAETPALPSGANPFKLAAGRKLYHQVGCVACHQPFDGPDGSESDLPARLAPGSIPLGPLATKYTVSSLADFLKDPLRYRPSGRMPSLHLSGGEAESVAMYLLRDQMGAGSNQPPGRLQGLFFEYFEGAMNQATEVESLTPVSTGSIENFSLGPQRRNNNIAFRYTGYLTLPRDGTYSFHLRSDDGSRLYLGDQLLVNNDGIHAPDEKRASIDLKAGEHPIMVLWFNGGGGAELALSYEGPGLDRQPIPDAALSYLGHVMSPLHAEQLTPDPAKVARGRAYFASLGCASCHEAGLPSQARPVPALLALGGATSRGCLAEQPAAGIPAFDLTPPQRAALRQVLSQPDRLRTALTPREQVHFTMAANNCLACHERSGQGGPVSERSGYFSILTKDDLGDEGRVPPHLNGVGAKLRPEWVRTVLLEQGKVRPYMATRMPKFDPNQVSRLVDAFPATDLSEPEVVHPASPSGDAKYGRLLVGSKGLSCISCHRFGSYDSLGIQAMDLTQMTKRLRDDWFHRYLVNPTSLRPGTRMPSFWPEGKSLRDDVLEGDTERQIQAIWTYLSQSGDAGIPHGLIQGRMELSHTSEALIYRAFINQSGTRGIGVAYPEQANLTFDGNEMRLALIWQGPFIDAAKHRSGRGAGFEGPLGYNMVEMPAGAPFAQLDQPDSPWPSGTGRDAGYQMLGYQLDQKRRPTFRYSAHGVRIEDFPEAVPGELEAFLRRTLTLSANPSPEGFWFRAWRGSRVERKDDGFELDGKVRMTFDLPEGRQPILRQSEGQTELLVPIHFQAGKASLVQSIHW